MKRSENDNKPGGFIAVDKPFGVTSHDVVFKARKLFQTSRIGHTGTLDPMATGVLVLLVGRAAKACEYISKDKKVYLATLRLGYETDTQDVTGAVVSVRSIVGNNEILKDFRIGVGFFIVFIAADGFPIADFGGILDNAIIQNSIKSLCKCAIINIAMFLSILADFITIEIFSIASISNITRK